MPDQRIDGSHHWGQTQRHPSQHGSRQDHDLNPAEDGGGTVPADRQDGNIVYEQGTREMYRVGERLEDILWKNRNLTEASAEIVRTAQGRFLS